MSDELQKTLHYMKKFGGSFACHIAEAWTVADSTNSAKLAEAFPNLLDRYHPRNWETDYARSTQNDVHSNA